MPESSSDPQFSLTYTFTGHSAPINVLSFSKDQLFLLSGADDGLLIIWNLSTGAQHQVIEFLFHGPITAAAWAYPSIDSARPHGLLVGCANGNVHFYRRDRDTFMFVTTEQASPRRGPIEEIVYDPVNSRAATATSPAYAALWKLEQDGSLTKLQSTTREDEIISALAFVEQGNQLVVCYLESHEVLSIQVDTWATTWHCTLPKRIGSALVLPTNGLVTTNLMTGVELFDFPPTRLLQAFPKPFTHNIRLQLASLWGGRLLVVGSDDGRPRVIKPIAGSGTEFDCTLPHGDGWVQTVAALDSPRGSVVATGGSQADASPSLKVWRCTQSSGRAAHSTSKIGSTSTSLTVWQLGLIVFFCCFMQTLTSRVSSDTISELLAVLPPALQIELPPPDISTSVPADQQKAQGRQDEQQEVLLEGFRTRSSTRDLELWKGEFQK